MQLGAEIRPWEWMIKNTPQHNWIEGKGKLIWLALFFTETGAGLFFVSVLFGSLPGMLSGWLICLVLGCGSFLLHLGHPLGSIRAVLKVKTSWISRGIILLNLFGVVGLMNMVLIYFAPGLNFILLKYITAVICILVAIYAGMLLSYIKAIQLWNTGMLPLSFVVAALWGGAEMLLGINILTAQSAHHLELWVRILLPSFALIVLLYLVSIWYSSPTGAASVKRIVAGDLAVKFYLGVVIIGLIFPIAVVLSNIIGSTGLVPELLFLAAIVCGLIGDMTMRYCIMKGALYKPLI